MKDFPKVTYGRGENQTEKGGQYAVGMPYHFYAS